MTLLSLLNNQKMTAINTAISIDLTGQVNADSIGTKHYSGVGGQVDFIYGASRAKGGKAIIAMPSVTKKGVSNNCSDLIRRCGYNHISPTHSLVCN